MADLTLEEIVDSLALKPGMRLMVSSDITRLWAEYRRKFRDFSPNRLIALLQEKITHTGTLLFPTYSWDFCHGEGFDYFKTIPRTGGLGRTALTMSDFRRTQHPMYSFAVWGKEAEELCAMTNKSSFGGDSPFEYLNERNVEHLMIDLPFTKGYTFVHYIEEKVQVPYRYMKNFTDAYTDAEGLTSRRTYSMYVRDLDMDLIYTDAIEPFLSPFVKQKAEHYGVEFKMIRYADTYSVIKDDILYNRSRNLATYKGQ
ncbi:MAG: hypothetical protein HFE84_12500 [Lachnospiraceae bacterium]|jgi:aminoglycoside 3-N-acetyltransferase|nr:hypothetical protein [Lachnospiraceae bacterium]